MLIGSHVGMKGKEMLLGAAKEAASYNASTFMIYTGAPQNTRRKAIAELNIPAGKEYMAEHGLSQIVVHAPYIVNLANTKKPGNFDFAVQFLREEVKRAEALGATQMTLHPGAHVGLGAHEGIKNIARGLNEVIEPDQKIQIALETMAGKGTEVGRSFEELAQIIELVEHDDKVSVTFDTCHTNDAGYDVKNNFDGVLAEFDKVIGLERLQVIHLNDSQNERGSHKDRHANLGFGTIGFATLEMIARKKEFETIAKILETPYVGPDKNDRYAPYAYELAMLRTGEFDPDLLEKVYATKGKLV